MGARHCPDCQRKADAVDRDRRGSSSERGYGARWQAYRASFLLGHPLCVLCLVSGPPKGDGRRAITPATVVDHIRAHKGDPILFWDPENHRAVCKPHHDQRVDEGDFGRPPS
jgi:5-methylcytosine-specific restriction protein A